MATKRAFFTDDQKAILAKSYENSPYPTSAQKEALATVMKKPSKHFGNWFKNERARQIKNQNTPSGPTKNLAIKNIIEVKEENHSTILKKIVKIKPIVKNFRSILQIFRPFNQNNQRCHHWEQFLRSQWLPLPKNNWMSQFLSRLWRAEYQAHHYQSKKWLWQTSK